MSAPIFRAVEQHTGQVAKPSKFWAALSEADLFCAERDAVAELQTRLQELEAERDDLAEQLADLRVTHMRVVCENARLRKAGPMIIVVAVFWLLAIATILAVVSGGADLVPAPFDPVAEAERILAEEQL